MRQGVLMSRECMTRGFFMTVAACAIALAGFLEPCPVRAGDVKPGDAPMRPWAPIGCSFFQPKWQFPGQTNSVFGAMINLGVGNNRDICPLNIGIGNIVDRNMIGLQLGMGNRVNCNMAGLQFGLVSVVKNCQGIQCSLINAVEERSHGLQFGLSNETGTGYGVQAGFYNKASRFHGMQLGVINNADDICGMQIGLFNIGYTLRGVQVGLINISEGDGGKSAMAGGFTVLPLINMRF